MSYRKFKICEALTPHIARKMKIGWALFELSALKHVIESAEIPDNACFLEKYNFGRDRRKVILQNTLEGVVLIVDIDQFEGSIYYRQCGQQKSVLITIPRYKGKQINIEFASPYYNLKHKEPDMGMEFDKSKILTVVTADQAKVGDLGWFGDTLPFLKGRVGNEEPMRLGQIVGGGTVSSFCDLYEFGICFILSRLLRVPPSTMGKREQRKGRHKGTCDKNVHRGRRWELLLGTR